METVVVAMSVLAFGIACGTIMYNVHEFKHISREFREGNERLLKHMNEGHENIARILERIAKRLK